MIDVINTFAHSHSMIFTVGYIVFIVLFCFAIDDLGK